MRLNESLSYLEKAWVREDILLKIQNGLSTDEIVNEFLVIQLIDLIYSP